ncbi:hypothetical protein OF83DRAFT_1081077 [Amylostereum chailletii]|nr:hypothetical protein OF83DRAFT_1081077 [Amylostereum chailletii]
MSTTSGSEVSSNAQSFPTSGSALPPPSAASRSGSTTSEQPATSDSADGSNRQRKRKRKEEAPLPAHKQPLYTPWLSAFKHNTEGTTEQRLHDEIDAYTKYILPTPAEVTARDKVIDRVEKVIMQRFRDAQVHVYGSTRTNLSLPDGDIDVVIETKYVDTPNEKKSSLFQLRGRLQTDGIAATALVVPGARVPVLNMLSTPETGSFNVDISINGLDGVQTIDIVKSYLDAMPALRPLVLVIKGLLAQHGLHSAATSGLSSYAVICMAISFLQLNPANSPQEDMDSPASNRALGILLMDFLKYYATDFPYTTSYISVTNKALLIKADKGWDTGHADRLSIECLVDPENDIARSAGKMRQVRELFQRSYDALCERNAEVAEGGLLGRVVRISQEVCSFSLLDAYSWH